MDWNEIRDRKGIYQFVSFGKVLTSIYFPEDIQTLVDTVGVPGMVKIVNERYQQLYHRNALHILDNGGDKKVIQA